MVKDDRKKWFKKHIKEEIIVAVVLAIIFAPFGHLVLVHLHLINDSSIPLPSVNDPRFFNKTTGETLEWLSDSKTALFVNKLSQVDINNSTIYIIKFYIGNPTDHTIYVDFFDVWLSNSTYSVQLRYPVSQELAPKETLVEYVDTKNTNYSSSGPEKFNIAIHQKDKGFSLYNVYL
jgi:hypothetical protein